MKIAIFWLGLAVSLLAEGIHWTHDYAQAIEAAKAQNKPLMVYIYRSDCGVCRYMEKNTFADPFVQAYLNDNFIALKALSYDNKLPAAMNLGMTPVIHFVDENAQEVEDSILGGKKPDYFLETLQDVITYNKRYQEHSE